MIDCHHSKEWWDTINMQTGLKRINWIYAVCNICDKRRLILKIERFCKACMTKCSVVYLGLSGVCKSASNTLPRYNNYNTIVYCTLRHDIDILYSNIKIYSNSSTLWSGWRTPKLLCPFNNLPATSLVHSYVFLMLSY